MSALAIMCSLTNRRRPDTVSTVYCCHQIRRRHSFVEYIEKDLIAVRVSPDLKPAIVGSPGYLKSQGEAKNAS